MTIKEFRRKYNDSSEFVFGLVLKRLTGNFITKCIKLELESVNKQISEMKDADNIYTVNGIDKVNWSKYENLLGWDRTDEEQAVADRVRKTLSNCENLLYTRNRLIKVNQL